jgi:rare lipoprotein A
MKIFENISFNKTNFNTFTILVILLFVFSIFSLNKSFAQTNKGIASYYANKFVGRKTTSGVKYCHDSLTAAHKTLPFGTLVKVTNVKNGKSTVVKVNDRLPKKSRRIIDLSKKAATELDMLKNGVVRVEIEVLKLK